LLTGIQRTANIITEEASEFLIIPSKVMKRMTQKYGALNMLLHTTIGERPSLMELPRGAGLTSSYCATWVQSNLIWKRNLPRREAPL